MIALSKHRQLHFTLYTASRCYNSCKELSLLHPPSLFAYSQSFFTITMHFFTPTLLFAAAGLAEIAAAAYSVQDDYSGNNFFNMFTFDTVGPLPKTLSEIHCESNRLIYYQEYDPTNGYVNYLDESDAQNANLISVDNGVVTIRSDSSNIASGRGRNSVRITSRNQYTHGLVVLDLQHMPSAACGIWPAFWTTGPSVSYFPACFLSFLCPKPQRPLEESAWDIY